MLHQKVDICLKIFLLLLVYSIVYGQSVIYNFRAVSGIFKKGHFW